MQRCQSWLPYIKTLAYSVCEEISYKLYHCSTTPPRTKDGVNQYVKSLDYFIDLAINKKVDVASSNHTAVDNGLERIAYSRKRMSYMPSFYIIGLDGFQKFCQVFRTMSCEMLERL